LIEEVSEMMQELQGPMVSEDVGAIVEYLIPLVGEKQTPAISLSVAEMLAIAHQVIEFTNLSMI
jgi:hypothetical protein